MAKSIHTMIRVLDEETAVDFYKKAFGLSVLGRFEFDGFTLVYMKNAEADFEIELTVNKDQQAPYTHGDAYGHLAFAVDDLDAEYARFEGKCQRRSKISPPGRSKTSPLNVMRYAVLGGSCGPTGSTIAPAVKQVFLGISAVFGFG